MSDHVDVLIVGAGLSGIGAAVHLTSKCPGRTYKIFEARDNIGGTWDLFRYPGIRSDSDMHTLGYVFKPWTEAKAIADGPSIRKYVRETADEYGVREHICFGHTVTEAAWDSQAARWTVTATDKKTGQTLTQTCNFLYMCAGYYDYEAGYVPDFENMEAYKGTIVYPQHWPQDLDHSDKTIVVIGSGATAVTIVPVMARTARHVTMLQRSPTYMVSRPAEDRLANFLRAILPDQWAYNFIRARNVFFQKLMYQRTRTQPEKVRQRLLDLVRKEVGPDFDVATHFTPRYNPWDQRLCLVPDNDFFHALRDGGASIVTDHIDRFTEEGIVLKSGETLSADIVVVATGLKMKVLGGLKVTVDEAPVDLSDQLYYRGMMFSNIPNLAAAFGYLNASWTLKADLISDYVCRLLNHMDATHTQIATPVQNDPDIEKLPFTADFSSGYLQRAIPILPKQGRQAPWHMNQDYAEDRKLMQNGELEDGVMQFSAAQRRSDRDAIAAE